MGAQGEPRLQGSTASTSNQWRFISGASSVASSLAAPSRDRRRASRQVTECGRKSDDIGAFRLARDDWPVGNGFVGVTGQGSLNVRIGGHDHIQSGPTEMGFAVNSKSEAEIAMRDAMAIQRACPSA